MRLSATRGAWARWQAAAGQWQGWSVCPALLAPDASVTCHKCANVCTVEAAIHTALQSGVVKKLSDHRVVQDR